MRVSLVSALVVAAVLLVTGAPSAQAQKKDAQPAKGYSHSDARDKANEHVVMLLGGTAGGPYITLAQNIANAVNEKDKLRVIPLASDGAMGNIRDVLLLRGVDMGITSVQALNIQRASGSLGPDLEKRLAYIALLTVGPFHVLARPEIRSVKDLNGKKVNILQARSGTSRYGVQILKALGVEIDPINATHTDAVQMMTAGKLDATLCVCPIPVPALAAVKRDLGFRLLEVPYIPALEENFLPASITNEHYANLVPGEGEKVQTVATSTILITYNWQPGGERYRKVAKFVDAFFSNIENLRKPPYPPAWKDVNIAASIRGWRRFPPAQEWLDRQTVKTTGTADAGPRAASVLPRDRAERERLFEEFLEWSRRQPRR